MAYAGPVADLLLGLLRRPGLPGGAGPLSALPGPPPGRAGLGLRALPGARVRAGRRLRLLGGPARRPVRPPEDRPARECLPPAPGPDRPRGGPLAGHSSPRRRLVGAQPPESSAPGPGHRDGAGWPPRVRL